MPPVSRTTKYLPSVGCAAVAVYWLFLAWPWVRGVDDGTAGSLPPLALAAVFAALAIALPLRVPGARVATYSLALLMLGFVLVGLPYLADRPYASSLAILVCLPGADGCTPGLLIAVLLFGFVVVSLLASGRSRHEPRGG